MARLDKPFFHGVTTLSFHAHVSDISPQLLCSTIPRSEYYAPSTAHVKLSRKQKEESMVAVNSMVEAKHSCEMFIPEHLQGLDPEATLFATIHYTGVITPIYRSKRSFSEGDNTEGPSGDLMYAIDHKKRKACYALLSAIGFVEETLKVGWAVFDECNLVEGDLFATQVSTIINFDEKGNNSYDVLILALLQEQRSQYIRMGMGEILQLDWFNGQPYSLIGIPVPKGCSLTGLGIRQDHSIAERDRVPTCSTGITRSTGISIQLRFHQLQLCLLLHHHA